MKTAISQPIDYFLVFDNDFLNINQLLGKTIAITFVKFQCLNCGRDKPIFRQGFDKQCFYAIPQAGDWLMRPELSKAHLGQADRDLAYEKRVQLQPHIVYLANSGTPKVGVTRQSQLPTRWIDQGAHEALEILEVPNRYLAGVAEVALKPHIGDKTNWRKMLKNTPNDVSLIDWRARLKSYLPESLAPYFIEDKIPTQLNYPVVNYPKTPKSLQLLKTQSYTGTLVGVKGQYLIFEDDTVFNIRANEGLVVRISLC